MTKIIQSRNNTFKFYDNHTSPHEINEESPYLEVKITVTEKEYDDNKRFYYIDYDYKLIVTSNICEAKLLNIFRRIFPFNNDEYDSNGGVVYKNELVSKMVDYILMNDEELEKYTNLNTAQTYRTELMKALISLWD